LTATFSSFSPGSAVGLGLFCPTDATQAAVAAAAAPPCGVDVRVVAGKAGWANLTVGPHVAPFPLAAGAPVAVRVLLDASVAEVFVAGGRAVITHRAYPGRAADGVALVNAGAAPAHLDGFEGFKLERAAPPSLAELRQHAAHTRARAAMVEA
jgi:hypothetical protein